MAVVRGGRRSSAGKAMVDESTQNLFPAKTETFVRVEGIGSGRLAMSTPRAKPPPPPGGPLNNSAPLGGGVPTPPPF